MKNWKKETLQKVEEIKKETRCKFVYTQELSNETIYIPIYNNAQKRILEKYSALSDVDFFIHLFKTKRGFMNDYEDLLERVDNHFDIIGDH